MGTRGLAAAGFRDVNGFVGAWNDRIGNQLLKLGVPYNELDDRRQEVYVRIIQTGHLEKYDPERSNFPTHIFQVCKSVAVNAWRQKSKRPLDMADSLIEATGSNWDESDLRRVKVLELLLVDSVDMDSRIDATEQLEFLRAGLSEGYLWSRKTQESAIRVFGDEAQNNLWQVALWLYVDGHKVTDLADMLGVRHGSVSNWKRRIIEKAQIFSAVALEA